MTAQITYIEHDGTAHTVPVQPGQSLMEAAVRNNVPGILAECGGACACATCHVYVDEAWRGKVGPANINEAPMLEFAIGADETSRLACQIRVTPDLDGLVVRMPVNQL